MRLILKVCLGLLPCMGVSAFDKAPSPQINYYQARYPLKDASQKQVDNYGNGDERLYGTRNFRMILNGVAYRGGANNSYNKYHKRPNQNPLPTMGLDNLCKEGFGTAVYLYSTNYASAPYNRNCSAVHSSNWTIQYLQKSPYDDKAMHDIFSEIMKIIYEPERGPIYIHCWNGWHASGLAAALILRQFCGVPAEAAVQYWNKNTDSHSNEPSFTAIRDRIRAFQPSKEFVIDYKTQHEICPAL